MDELLSGLFLVLSMRSETALNAPSPLSYLLHHPIGATLPADAAHSHRPSPLSLHATMLVARSRQLDASRFGNTRLMDKNTFALALIVLVMGGCMTDPPSPRDLAPMAGASKRPLSLLRGTVPVTPDDMRCLTAIRAYQGMLDEPHSFDLTPVRERMEIECAPRERSFAAPANMLQ